MPAESINSGVIQKWWTAVDGGWLGEWLGEWLQECRWDDWESDWGMIGRVIGGVAGFFWTYQTAVDGTDDGPRIAIPAWSDTEKVDGG
eukprot:gene12846-biopygen9431